MPEIEELSEDFDELPEQVETDDEVVESNEVPDGKQDKTKTEESINGIYNFDKATIIMGLQILPLTTKLERQVLITAGIKGEPPVSSSTTLSEVEQLGAIADILEKLKQSLPQIAEKAKLREEKYQKIQEQKKPQRVVSTPELPQSISTSSTPPSNQLSLF